MEIGCGARVRDFDGRRYFYFWHYEREAGRSVRREDYVGRVGSERARQELLRRMAAYHGWAEAELARRRVRVERHRRGGACLRVGHVALAEAGPRSQRTTLIP